MNESQKDKACYLTWHAYDILGTYFLWETYESYGTRRRSDKAARRLAHFSLEALFLRPVVELIQQRGGEFACFWKSLFFLRC